ncbi:hypothetical protein BX616_000853 [Lobosporangium transversale]|uniref:Peptidase M20 domain-containing protein 2 n=1 Tax=Lobosporangium transversale TaxID=64571 RepID=A0A1Y2GGJ2_9FUNG|nr:hypothetical protein BCR41DRAFT_338868 [Lobosporangium transversale]KAF9906002.1 hypothetical protein BX616_000853 [Lobosporangium transversale]ORZ10301.1 hypothetical protein BCR41DRAFT_338868 [Lobosporangium transversale]|eukprot:XP_021879208.1 hypothetical protein BCR41DRAFT_338868 [Lobosporangium transversale]
MQQGPGKDDALEAIDNADASLRQLSIQIHDHPELGYEEHFAHKTLTDYLEQQGFQVTRQACDISTAFIAEYENQGSGSAVDEPIRSVGFCSEYDALPSIGHGCGHNLIAISGVAAALGVKAAMEKNNIRGKVRLLGTPAEETLGGKRPMLERGAFNGLDACMMVHPAQFDVLYRQPLGVGRFDFEFHGKASHASASPWEGINALDAVCMTYNAIGLFRQQTLPTNRIHSIVTNGGQAANIIPELASMTTLYRANKNEDLLKLHDQIAEIAKSSAEASGCTLNIKEPMQYSPLNNNPPLADRFGEYMKSFGVRYNSREVDETTPAGSTDMGNVTVALPGIHPVFNIASLDGEREPGLTTHSALFAERAGTEVAHKATIRAAKGLSLTALDVLLDAEFAKSIREEFERSKPKIL